MNHQGPPTRPAQMTALCFAIGLVVAFFLYALVVTTWNHFELWKVTPW